MNSPNLTIPDNNLGSIMISTIGRENDVGFKPVPLIF
jgi:hypothetical protein